MLNKFLGIKSGYEHLQSTYNLDKETPGNTNIKGNTFRLKKNMPFIKGIFLLRNPFFIF